MVVVRGDVITVSERSTKSVHKDSGVDSESVFVQP